MDVREKLVELLDDIQLRGEDFTDCEIYGMRLPDTISNEDVASHLIAHGVTVQEWIPVTERLPECDQVVLCYKADRGVRTGKHLAATYADGVSAFKDCCRDYAFGATHWMPLPQPPKGE